MLKQIHTNQCRLILENVSFVLLESIANAFATGTDADWEKPANGSLCCCFCKDAGKLGVIDVLIVTYKIIPPIITISATIEKIMQKIFFYKTLQYLYD